MDANDLHSCSPDDAHPVLNSVLIEWSKIAAIAFEGALTVGRGCVVLTLTETPFGPWFIEESVRVRAERDDVGDTMIETLKRLFRGRDYLLFRISAEAPAAPEVYVVYFVGE